MQRIIVKQDKEKPIPVEVMAESIKRISEGIKKLRQGPLNDKALILLIQHATPGNGYNGKPSGKEVRNILDGIESLERIYLKKK